MKHQHKYDVNGKQLCCTLEEKINTKTNKKTGAVQLTMTTNIQTMTVTPIQAQTKPLFKCSCQQS